MGRSTKIEWADSTVSPAPCCVGCELFPDHCFAAKMTKHFAGNPGVPKSFTTPTLFLDRIEKASLWSDLTGTNRPDKPWLNGRPRMIFLNDMGDPFAPFDQISDVSNARAWSLDRHWLSDSLETIERSPHIWMILTKWPDRFADFAKLYGPMPRNLWGGTSVTPQNTTWRICELLKIDLDVRFLSLEPLLGPLDIRGALGFVYTDQQSGQAIKVPAVNGVIVGPETGPGRRPCDPEWIRSIIDQCKAAGVPAFVKAFPVNGKVSKNMAEWPAWARRRELPEVKR
jgi:protein gp37